MKTLLTQLADYNSWANSRFVERLVKESDEVLDSVVPSSFPSLRTTLLHIRNAEHTWWGRVTGTPTTWPVDGSIAIEGLIPCSEQLQQLVQGLSHAEFDSRPGYKDLRGNTHTQLVWQMLLHCFNHSTQHRGQLITMMRTLQLDDIPANDLIVFQRL